jgi:hypothetical protein
MSGGHLAWTDAGVAVTGTFMGRDTETGLAYVKTEGRHIHFSQPADLRRQLRSLAPGTAVTITYMGQQGDRKMFQVTTRRCGSWPRPCWPSKSDPS